ncbi:MAG: hypothetical protein R2710_24165 [Acidimicrobiales bacterium]
MTTTKQGTSHPILISGDAGPTPVGVLAGLSIDLSKRGLPVGHPVRVTVIDRSDRSLIRLRQLPTIDSYVTIDDLDGIDRLLEQLDERTLLEPRVTGLDLLVINELARLLDFLTRTGRADLAQRLGDLVARHDGDRLMVAASCSAPDQLPSEVRSQFRASLDCGPDGSGRLANPTGESVIDLREWSPDRVTSAVASIIQPAA